MKMLRINTLRDAKKYLKVGTLVHVQFLTQKDWYSGYVIATQDFKLVSVLRFQNISISNAWGTFRVGLRETFDVLGYMKKDRIYTVFLPENEVIS
jgi:hypothetical protein